MKNEEAGEDAFWILHSKFELRNSIFRGSARGGLFLALKHHADVIGRAGLEVDGGDAHQLPPLIAEPVQLLGAPRIHRVILGPDVDDLVLPGLHGPAPSRGAEWIRAKCIKTCAVRMKGMRHEIGRASCRERV